MSKRYFKVSAYGGGGELVIGRVSAEFVEDHLDSYGDEIFEAIQEQTDDEWHDVDDVEHISGAAADCTISFVEVDSDGDELDEPDAGNVPTQGVYCRESGLFSQELPDEVTDEDDYVPVVAIFQIEKGSFFEAIVETDGADFDPDLVHFGLSESNISTIIEQMWYDQKLIELNTDWYDSNHKGVEATVGYMNLRWQEHMHDYMDGSEIVAEAFEYV